MDRIQLYRDLYFLGLVLVIVTLPFDITVNNIAIIFHVLTSILFLNKERVQVIAVLKSNKVGTLFSLYAGAYLLFSLVHFNSYDDLNTVIKDLEARAAFLLFPITLTGVTLFTSSKIHDLKRTYIIMAILASVVCFVIAILKTVEAGTVYSFDENNVLINNFMYHRFSHWIGIHAVYLAAYVAIAFFVVLDGIVRNFKSYSRPRLIRRGILAGYFLIVVVLLKSITISLIVLLILGGVVLYYSANKLRFSTGVFASVLVGYLVIAAVFGYFMYEKLDLKRTLFEYKMDQMPPEANWNSFNLRLAKWEISRQVISDHWLAGVGPGNITKVMDEYYDLNNFYYAKAAHYNPHNQYLHSFIVLGVTGFLLVMLMFVSLVYKAVVRRDVVLAVFTLVFAFFCITESVFAVNKGIVFFTFIGCLLTYLRNPFAGED